MRPVRKVTAFVCTTCYQLFASRASAHEHADRHPRQDEATAARRKGPSQTSQVLAAIRGGARDARAIQRQTRLPLARVHTLLSYHRRRGNVRGYNGDLRAH